MKAAFKKGQVVCAYCFGYRKIRKVHFLNGKPIYDVGLNLFYGEEWFRPLNKKEIGNAIKNLV